MASHGYTLFDTAIGRCGVAWNERGIVAVQLPETRDVDTPIRLARRAPGAQEAPPPAATLRAINGISALLRGEAIDLTSVALDMDRVPPFHRRVYTIARAIAPGQTLTYGEVAAQLGAAGLARAVGQALGRNPFPIIVPCHRVLAANGKIGGFSASGGIATKLKMLAIERAANAEPGLFDDHVRLGYDAVAAVDHLRSADRALARVIDEVGPLRLELKNTTSVFGALAEAIVYQQLTGKAAATIFARVRALFPRPHEGLRAQHIVRASIPKLRSAGLSQAKALALQDLARRTVDGWIPTLGEIQELDDAAIIERLTAVRGVGRWTVEMLLIFRLGRPDVLPLDDLGIRKGFAVVFKKRELPQRHDLEKRGARWQPYRSAASWYLWRAAELATLRGM
jgi:methylated-DNA-[protein]-cysteine S-methyltransferase